MSQTSIIAGAFIVAFVVFITVRGELPCYLEVLGISSGGTCQSPAMNAGSAIGNILTGVLGGTGTPATGSAPLPSNPNGVLIPCPNGGYTLTGIC